MKHYSVETLSGYLKGELRVRKSTRVSAHLKFCFRCREHVAHLRHMSTVLASVQFTPIPDHLCTKIEMAIAAEASARVTTQSRATSESPVVGASLSGEASRRDLPERAKPARRRLRMPTFSSPLATSLAAAGAAVVIAGGGYELATHLGASSSSENTSTSAVPAAGKPAHSGTAAAPTNLMFGPEVHYSHGGHSHTINAVRTGTDFEPGTLRQQTVAALGTVRTANLKQAGNTFSSPLTPSATNGVNADQLHGCVSKVAAGQDVLLVDLAKYESKAATVIVVGKAPNGPGTVYVVGPGCSATNPDILTKQYISHL
jgi:predicted anti-sigma-YlaC factor YlaD